MELTKQEKELLKFILKNEQKKIENEEEYMKRLRPDLKFLAAEEKYEELLEKLIKKLESK